MWCKIIVPLVSQKSTNNFFIFLCLYCTIVLTHRSQVIANSIQKGNVSHLLPFANIPDTIKSLDDLKSNLEDVLNDIQFAVEEKQGIVKLQ